MDFVLVPINLYEHWSLVVMTRPGLLKVRILCLLLVIVMEGRFKKRRIR